jgi:hypothetical protein
MAVKLGPFSVLLQLATVGNLNSLFNGSRITSVGLDLSHKVHARCHLTEHHVLSVQPSSFCSGDEELRAVGVGTRIRHGQQACNFAVSHC